MEAWTDETDEKADLFFATLPDKEIRRRQDLCNQQIERAFAQGNEKALGNLQRMQDALTRAMLAR